MKAMVSSMLTLFVVYQSSSHLYWFTVMRVAIDATPLLMRSSGVKNYVYYWIRSLQQLAGARAISAFPFLGPSSELNHEVSAVGYWETRARLAFVFASNYLPVPILNLAARGLDVFH